MSKRTRKSFNIINVITTLIIALTIISIGSMYINNRTEEATSIEKQSAYAGTEQDTDELVDNTYKKTDELTDGDIQDDYQKNYQETEDKDGSYLTKSVEWVDKKTGDALIKIDASQISNKETTALYVATFCYAHGLTEDILVENIGELLNYYDTVDFVAINNAKEAGIVATKQFKKGATSSEIRSYVSSTRNAGETYPHYINTVPLAIQKYLFGNIGDEYISRENIIKVPTAIYVSCDTIYTEPGTYSYGLEYCTEKYFKFMDEEFGDRYFSMSQWSQQSSTQQIILKEPSSNRFNENKINIVLGVLNPCNYGQATSALSESTINQLKNATSSTEFNAYFTDKKYAAQYSYDKNFKDSGVKMISNCLLLDTVSDYYEIVSVEATTDLGRTLTPTIEGQKVTVEDYHYFGRKNKRKNIY